MSHEFKAMADRAEDFRLAIKNVHVGERVSTFAGSHPRRAETIISTTVVLRGNWLFSPGLPEMAFYG
jgi:hypothetical protein